MSSLSLLPVVRLAQHSGSARRVGSVAVSEHSVSSLPPFLRPTAAKKPSCVGCKLACPRALQPKEVGAVQHRDFATQFQAVLQCPGRRTSCGAPRTTPRVPLPTVQ